MNHLVEILTLKLTCLIMQKKKKKKKTVIKNIPHADTSSLALKSNLASLKTEVDKLDINKLVPASVDLSKLSDIVKNNVVKKTVYNKLVAQVDSTDISAFVLKTKFDKGKKEKIKFLILVVLFKRNISML